METTIKYSSQSKESVDYLHKAISEILAWSGDPMASLNQAIAADNTFGFPYVVQASLEILGTGVRGDDPKLLSILKNAGDRMDHATENEKLHYEAFLLSNEGRYEPALEIWRQIIEKTPWDVLALRYYMDVLFYVGHLTSLYEICQKLLPVWNQNKDHPYYGYIMGMASFGYEEVGQYDEAAKLATIGLKCHPNDGWSAHTRAHVYEMLNQTREGIEFMMKHVTEWSQAIYLACHNFWHVALYHIEYAEFEDALRIADGEVLPRTTSSGAMLDMVDASSILLRLEFQGVDVGIERWQKVFATWESHVHDHILSFNDAHLMMALIGSKQPEEKINEFVASLEQYVNKKIGNQKTSNQRTAQDVGLPIIKAMHAYSKGEYQTATDLLVPIQDQIIRVGGSNAQRDVFMQLSLMSAIKAKDSNNAKELLRARFEAKPNSPMNMRFNEQLNAVLSHIQS